MSNQLILALSKGRILEETLPLLADAGRTIPARQLMTHVLCDRSQSDAACAEVTARFGIPCHRLPLRQTDQDKYDTRKVAELLVSLG